MSEPDKYDDEVAEMLPCWFVPESDCMTTESEVPCWACQKRPAVAARLRAYGMEIERLRNALNMLGNEPMDRRFEAARVEIAQLRAQLAALHGKIMNLPIDCKGQEISSFPVDAYRQGYRDARHAAAELCLTLAQM